MAQTALMTFIFPFTTVSEKHRRATKRRQCLRQLPEFRKNHSKPVSAERLETRLCVPQFSEKYQDTSRQFDQLLATESTAFSWLDQWYPVALEIDLERRKPVPTPFYIFGQRFVIWRTRNKRQRWAIFRDVCPHRFAALSEGRIDPDTGNLQCKYHGWQFDDAGKCRVIPQSNNQSAVDSPLACATKLPSRSCQGIVFVWLGADPPPANKRPAVLQNMQESFVTSSITRDLPFSFLTLMQNVLDPSHVHFAHHSQIGRRSRAGPVPIRIFPKFSADEHGHGPLSDIAFAADYYDGRVTVKFRPPCLVEICTSAGEAYAYYSVPIDAYRTRTIGVQTRMRRFPFSPPIPRWLDHLRRNVLVDADLVLMHGQEQELARLADTVPCNKDITTSWTFYMPTTSDRLIVELRKWLQQNPLPQTTALHRALIQLPSNRSELLDRYASHCMHCSSCRVAILNIERAIVALKFLSVALLVSAALVGMGLYPPTAVPVIFRPLHAASNRVANVTMRQKMLAVRLGFVSLLTQGTVWSLECLRKRFYYVEDARRQTCSS